MEVHVDAFAAEGDGFDLEAEALLGGGFATEFDVACGTYDALPGEAMQGGGAKEFGYGAMVEGVACGCRYFAVGGDFSPGNRPDDAAEGFVAGLVLAESFFENATLEILRDGGFISAARLRFRRA